KSARCRKTKSKTKTVTRVDSVPSVSTKSVDCDHHRCDSSSMSPAAACRSMNLEELTRRQSIGPTDLDRLVGPTSEKPSPSAYQHHSIGRCVIQTDTNRHRWDCYDPYIGSSMYGHTF